jgi:hypothetical protein
MLSSDLQSILYSHTNDKTTPYPIYDEEISIYLREKELTENYERDPNERSFNELHEFRQGPYHELGTNIASSLNIPGFVSPKEYFEVYIIPLAKMKTKSLTVLEHNYSLYQIKNYFWSLVFKTERKNHISPILSLNTFGCDEKKPKTIEDPYVIESFNKFKIDYTNHLAIIIYHSEILKRSNFDSCNRFVSREIFEILIRRNTAIIKSARNDLQKENIEMIVKASAYAKTHGDYDSELFSHNAAILLPSETDQSATVTDAISITEIFIEETK